MAYAPPQFDDASANLVPQEPPPPIGGVAQQRPAPLRAPRLGGLGTLTGAGDGYARLDNAESTQEDPELRERRAIRRRGRALARGSSELSEKR